MKAPPSWKIRKILDAEVTLHKITVSEIASSDPFGQVEEGEEIISKIPAQIQVITLQDLAYLPPGVVSEGDAWGFFLPSFEVDAKSYTVEVNDYITFKGVKYLVQRVEDHYQGEERVFRKAILKRVVR